jgi:hypothetical protein
MRGADLVATQGGRAGGQAGMWRALGGRPRRLARTHARMHARDPPPRNHTSAPPPMRGTAGIEVGSSATTACIAPACPYGENKFVQSKIVSQSLAREQTESRALAREISQTPQLCQGHPKSSPEPRPAPNLQDRRDRGRELGRGRAGQHHRHRGRGERRGHGGRQGHARGPAVRRRPHRAGRGAESLENNCLPGLP